MTNKLPVINYDNKLYYVDFRLNECRNVENPHDRIPVPEILEFEDFVQIVRKAVKKSGEIYPSRINS